MKKVEKNHAVLPALRGVMGDWVFYSCLMNINEISVRIQYADEVHSNKLLSEMIQRQLKKGRSEQISEYLTTQKERFFNSLVVATYGGEPSWYALSNVRSKSNNIDLEGISEETVGSIGFLTLRGDEKLFAIDGQHRLAGIKKAIKDGIEQDPYDDVSVIFVAHKTTSKGLERTRRLFTTLNKTARPVSKGDIVALDEDDAMAICTRLLIEKTELFNGNRIAFVASTNMPATNNTSLTTIVSLYDLLTILFTKTKFEHQKKRKEDHQKMRPSDTVLNEYFSYAKKFFKLLGDNFDELGEFFRSDDSADVVSKYRGSHGGSALFRPIGLDIFAEIIAKLNETHTLTKAIELASLLPRTLSEEPYAGLMWNKSASTIMNSHRVTLRELLLYMLGESKLKKEVLLARYKKDTGNEDIELPGIVV